MIIRDANIADVPAIARVHIDSWRSTYRGILPDDFLDALSLADREDVWRNIFRDPRYGKTTFSVVAEETSIVGFASGGPGRNADSVYDAEISGIYLVESQQRRGLGGRMMQALTGTLSNAGFSAVLVWVLAKNPSRRFYEALGGKEIRTAEISIGGTCLEEVAYGWTDIRQLANE